MRSSAIVGKVQVFGRVVDVSEIERSDPLPAHHELRLAAAISLAVVIAVPFRYFLKEELTSVFVSWGLFLLFLPISWLYHRSRAS